MGTWGIGVFEDDTACDFAAGVAEGGGLAMVEQALDRVLASTGDYLEAPDAQEGLAAAEIVARLKKRGGSRTPYTELVDAWVDRVQSAPSAALVEKARRSIARILAEPSELMELWQETDEFEAWKSAVDEVAARL